MIISSGTGDARALGVDGGSLLDPSFDPDLDKKGNDPVFDSCLRS